MMARGHHYAFVAALVSDCVINDLSWITLLCWSVGGFSLLKEFPIAVCLLRANMSIRLQWHWKRKGKCDYEDCCAASFTEKKCRKGLLAREGPHMAKFGPL